MKDIIIEESQGSFSIEALKDFEDKIGVKLPSCYVHFLHQHNGGSPIKDSFPIITKLSLEEYMAGISEFYYLEGKNSDYGSNLTNIVDVFKNRMPENFLAIGDNGCGDQICLRLGDQEEAKVYFWDHEEEADDGDPPRDDNVYLIANSFTDFVNSLYKFDIELNSKNRVKRRISTYDYIALPYSHYVRKYGDIITDFFAQAPKSTEDFVIEEMEQTDDIYLKYEDKEEKKRHTRHLKKSGELVGDSIEDI